MTTAIIIALAIYSCAMTVLAVVAPKTKTDKDDKALEFLKKGEPIAEMLKRKAEADKK